MTSGKSLKQNFQKNKKQNTWMNLKVRRSFKTWQITKTNGFSVIIKQKKSILHFLKLKKIISLNLSTSLPSRLKIDHFIYNSLNHGKFQTVSFFLYNLQSIYLLSVYSPFISLQCVVFFFVNLVLGGEYSKNIYTCL